MQPYLFLAAWLFHAAVQMQWYSSPKAFVTTLLISRSCQKSLKALKEVSVCLSTSLQAALIMSGLYRCGLSQA